MSEQLSVTDHDLGAVSPLTGETPLPEGERVDGHNGLSAVEESPSKLAISTRGRSLGSTTQAGDPSLTDETVTDSFLDIVRASGRIKLDLASLAVDRTEHIKRRCGGIEAGCPACIAQKTLFDTQREVARCLNAATRLCWRVDADTLDHALVCGQPVPKGAEWKPDRARMLTQLRSVVPGTASGTAKLTADQLVNAAGNLYTYPMIRLLAPGLSSSIAATLARTAENKWRQERWDILVRQSRRPPHYAQTTPIPIPAQVVRVLRDGDEYRVCFTLRTDSARQGSKKEFEWPIQGYDGHLRNILEGMIEGTYRMGSMSIEQDRLRPGRWYAKFAYTRRVDKCERDTLHAVGVNRGVTVFLAAVAADGARWLYDGRDIVAYLKQIQRRRQEYQRDSKASARWGHGRSRTLKPTLALQGKAERWRETKCQTIGRQFAKWVKEHGYTAVYIEDLSGVRDSPHEKLRSKSKHVWDMIQEWPFYKLQQAIQSCLEEYGILVTVVPAGRTADYPGGISETCPSCGSVSPGYMHLKTRTFECTACGHREHLDVAAAKNVLSRGIGGVPNPKNGTSRKPPRKPAKGKGDKKKGRER